MTIARNWTALLLIAGLLGACADFPIRPPPLIPLPTPDGYYLHGHHHHGGCWYHHHTYRC
jgi:hypothetical protein